MVKPKIKVALATSAGCDWLSSTLYRGLASLLGPARVFVATPGGGPACLDLGVAPPVPEGRQRLFGAELQFDLLVLVASFLREADWGWVVGHLGLENRGRGDRVRLKAGAKVVYVEAWDGPGEVHEAPFAPDAYFRREVAPGFAYPYPAKPLLFALPQSCFDRRRRKRPIDLCYLSNVKGIPEREGALRAAERFGEGRRVKLSESAVPLGEYADALRQSKFCVCPPGAGSDCLRQWEAVALGSVPVFVGHPPRERGVWFPDGTALWCDNPDDLPRLLTEALADDPEGRRRRLQEHAWRHHTAEARARAVLEAVGL